MDGNMEIKSPAMGSISGTRLNIPAHDGDAECRTPQLPPRLQRRLLQSKSREFSAQDIEAKLDLANLRRKQFHETLSKKARSKLTPRCSSCQEICPRLKAKHNAAEHKRLGILAQIQNRLARQDQLRQNAKNGLQMRCLKERDELNAKLQSRVQHAVVNRMLLLNAYRQRQVEKREKASQLQTKRLVQEKKYKECVWAAIHYKRTAAERKRLGLLEARKIRARASTLKVQQVAHSLDSQRDVERRKLLSQLENRLQKAKGIRAEYLKKRGALFKLAQASSETEKQKDLASKMKRCWRRFLRLKGTMIALAKAFEELNINNKTVKSMPFESLAVVLGSTYTIRVAENVLHRLENHITIRQQITGVNRGFHLVNIDHLLKRVVIPRKKANVSKSSSCTIGKKAGYESKTIQRSKRLSRYPVRVVLGAYMILAHPDVAASRMEEKSGLVGAAEKLAQEFDLLIKIILLGPIQLPQDACVSAVDKLNFSFQLENFDKAWCSFLYQFVIWKVKDVKLLEEDLLRAACQLELKRMDILKQTMERDNVDVTHLKDFLDQVTLQQRFLQEKVLQMSGNDGLDRMKTALSETRSGVRFIDGMELETLFTSTSDHLTSSSEGYLAGSIHCKTNDGDHVAEDHDNVGSVVPAVKMGNLQSSSDRQSPDRVLETENEWIMNELIHGEHSSLPDSINFSGEDQKCIKSRVRDIMEKAYWDGVTETLRQEIPDYSWVLKLMKEVKDELYELSPSSWKEEIEQTIDLDIMSQVAQVGSLDIEYCGKILDFSLVILQKLSAPAKEEELRTAHQKILRELSEISQEKSTAVSATLVVRGLRFVLHEIQALKHDISKTRISMIEPLIKGPAGIEYLRSSFATHYGSPSDALERLPLAKQWLSAILLESNHDWDEYQDSITALRSRDGEFSEQYNPITLRAGNSTLSISKSSVSSNVAGVAQPECKGEKLDILLRLGLLKLVSEVQGLTAERLPETLKLNIFRLRAIQSQIQKMIVICTSILVLRQILVSEHVATSGVDMENVISNCVEELNELLDRKQDVGIVEIVETMDCYPSSGEDPEKRRARKEIMANMLGRSLSAEDAVFARVSRNVYLAARGIVLGGSGPLGKELAETALKRVGAALLTQKLVDAVAGLVVMANVSATAHGPWYEKVLSGI